MGYNCCAMAMPQRDELIDEIQKTRRSDRVEVLVVDDERVIREGLTQKLVSAGFDVRLASDGRAAVQAFLLERPDLVLLDVMMPGMDGYATCEEMRKIDRETPIVFLSALDSEQDQIRGLEVGADDLFRTSSDGRSGGRRSWALRLSGRRITMIGCVFRLKLLI